MRFKWFSSSSSLRIGSATQVPVVSQEFRATVALRWKREKEQQAHLHDGELFYASNFASDHIQGYFGPYSHWYIQRKLNASAENSLVSVAVTGVVRQGKSVLLGRRGDGVTQDAGLFEFVPSGGVSRIQGTPNFREQLRLEFEEELGVSANLIQKIEPFGLVHDQQDHVLDILALLELSCDITALNAFNEEYKELVAVPLAELGSLPREEVSPLTRFVFDTIDLGALH